MVALQISQWNEHLAVKLTPQIVQTWDLHLGDTIDVTNFLQKKIKEDDKNQVKINNAIREMRKFRGLLPKDFKFDRESMNER